MRSILSQVLDLSIFYLYFATNKQHDRMIKGNILLWDKENKMRNVYLFAVRVYLTKKYILCMHNSFSFFAHREYIHTAKHRIATTKKCEKINSLMPKMLKRFANAIIAFMYFKMSVLYG